MARRRIRLLVLALLGTALSAYLVVVGWMFWHEVELIFRPVSVLSVVSPDLGVVPERVQFRGRDGANRLVWTFRTPHQQPAPWVVFLHGNGANVTTPGNVARCHQLTLLGLNVLAVEYPGFGELPGPPSENALSAAAADAWHWLAIDLGVPAHHIAVYGWSLGSGVATRLASEVDEAALVLEGAFTSVTDRAAELHPYLPVRWMLRHPFASMEHIGHIGAPLLLLHARDDEIIPFAHAERLLDAAAGPKQLVPLTGGHIVPNLVAEDDYLQALHTFFASIFPDTSLPNAPRSLAAVILGAHTPERRQSALRLTRAVLAGERAGYNGAPYAIEFAGRRWLDVDVAFGADILRANAAAHDRTAKAHETLGDALTRLGDTPGAERAFARAAALAARP